MAGRFQNWELPNDILQNHIINYYKDKVMTPHETLLTQGEPYLDIIEKAFQSCVEDAVSEFELGRWGHVVIKRVAGNAMHMPSAGIFCYYCLASTKLT